MHACGHDGHIAIGLGLAHRASENADALDADLTLLFQPAEEDGMGGFAFATCDATRAIRRMARS